MLYLLEKCNRLYIITRYFNLLRYNLIFYFQLANRSRVDALVQLKFKDIKGNICTATKRMFASNNNSKGVCYV